MKRKYVIYNPVAGDGNSEGKAKNLREVYKNEKLAYYDVTKIDNMADFVSDISSEDDIIICGGDGTLNRFVNSTYHMNLTNDIYYYPTGNGNDFWRDLDLDENAQPVLVNEYIKNLPTVTVNDKTYRFINGVGYGIDGYCCEVGDKLRAQGKKPNYTMIAIKGLLYGFKPTSAKVTIDGKTCTYKKIWIAPTMYGRFYGGGMMAAPNQKRNNADNTVSFVSMHSLGKIRTLMLFPSIFTGEHIKKSKVVEEIKGKNITVEFNRPTALQIDGETILNVIKYEVKV